MKKFIHQATFVLQKHLVIFIPANNYGKDSHTRNVRINMRKKFTMQ